MSGQDVELGDGLSGLVPDTADEAVARDPAVDPGIALRPLAEILDDEPALSDELLLSTRKLADRFFCPWGELLRAARPSRLAGLVG